MPICQPHLKPHPCRGATAARQPGHPSVERANTGMLAKCQAFCAHLQLQALLLALGRVPLVQQITRSAHQQTTHLQLQALLLALGRVPLIQQPQPLLLLGPHG